jgi:hypothetical protein
VGRRSSSRALAVRALKLECDVGVGELIPYAVWRLTQIELGDVTDENFDVWVAEVQAWYADPTRVYARSYYNCTPSTTATTTTNYPPLSSLRAFPSSCYAVPQVGEDAVRGTDQRGMTDLLRGETHEPGPRRRRRHRWA